MITITDEMKEVLDIINDTNDTLFVTGKAGTGKTTLLKHIKETVKKNMVIAAPTGVAAINAGGVTLHSLFNIPFGPLNPNAAIRTKVGKEKMELLNSIDVLVIDEISMVRPDVLDFVNQRLKLCRDIDEEFGGVQLVMFGDLFQLPPVIKKEDKKILLEFYDGYYFFNAQVFKNSELRVVELTQIFRQSEQDFIDLLNNIRGYNMTNNDLEMLEELRNKKISDSFKNKHIHICTHKYDVQRINGEMLGKHTDVFNAKISGDFSKSSIPCDEKLNLRVGARVMLLVNDREQGYCNGSLGDVETITEKAINVKLDDGRIVCIERYTWVNYDYKMDNGEIVETEKGKCTQFPITLAWAVTIHKSQGLTFDNIVIHTKGVFCPGQIYVALSRCRSIGGVVSDSFIGKKHIIPDDDLIQFEKTYKNNNGSFNLELYKMKYQ